VLGIALGDELACAAAVKHGRFVLAGRGKLGQAAWPALAVALDPPAAVA
jgi:hypothetical protein